jgi:hypothetical protein
MYSLFCTAACLEDGAQSGGTISWNASLSYRRILKIDSAHKFILLHDNTGTSNIKPFPSGLIPTLHILCWISIDESTQQVYSLVVIPLDCCQCHSINISAVFFKRPSSIFSVSLSDENLQPRRRFGLTVPIHWIPVF